MQRVKAVLGIAALAAGLVIGNAGPASAAPPSAGYVTLLDANGQPLAADAIFGDGGITTQAEAEAAPPGPITRGASFQATYNGVSATFNFAYQWLDRGKSWTFGNARLTMQTDGNLVIYNKSNVAKWSSGTYGKPITQMLFQHDANLVLYTSGYASAPWATGTSGRCDSDSGEAALLALQTDSNLVIYCGVASGNNLLVRPIWASNTQGI